MKKILFIFYLLLSFSVSSQEEKRLALVIGNSNYEKGELKNPVNDARLIASTLDSLDFDVILKENLETKRDMTAAIREFGTKRSEYDIAFIYYAGHGIQVDDENFLLPTKENFKEEYDVIDFGVSVQNIMRYLKAQTDQVNILILDACRDNPFESNWNKTRSLKGGGLAKIPPPTGSLIAFSTDSGQTAPDGDGENSVYTISLSKNMLLEDISIDQVFRNVRAEVLGETDGAQRPVEATQLTGQTFYLNISKLEDIAIKLHYEGNYEESISIILKDIKNKSSIKDDLSWEYLWLAINYSSLDIHDKAIEYASKSISFNQFYFLSFQQRGHAYAMNNQIENGLIDTNKAISLAKEYNVPEKYLGNLYDQKARILYQQSKYDLSGEFYLKAFEIHKSKVGYLLQIAINFQNNNKYKEAIKTYLSYEKILLDIQSSSIIDQSYTPEDITSIYSNLSLIYMDSQFKDYDFKKAIYYIEKAMEYEEEYLYYVIRGNIYSRSFKETKNRSFYNKALDDYEISLTKINNSNEDFADEGLKHSRKERITAIWEGIIQLNIIDEAYGLAIRALNSSIQVLPTPDALYKKAFVLFKQKKYFDSYKFIIRAIDLFKLNSSQILSGIESVKLDLHDLYIFRSKINEKIDNNEGVCEDLNKALLLIEEKVVENSLINQEKEVMELILENCN